MKTGLSLYAAVFLLLCCFSSCQKAEEELVATQTLTNSLNGYQYELQVFQRGSDPSDHVLFVLDPTTLIPLVAEQLDALGIEGSIAIVQVQWAEGNERVRDYTPIESNGEGGEADAYYSFVQSTVWNELLNLDLVDPEARKILIGHSLGGMSGAYAFCQFNDFYSGYLLLSPALWWGDFNMFQIESERRTDIQEQSAQVFIGIGEREDFGMQNGFESWVQILLDHYPNVDLSSEIVSGSHYGSRDELLFSGLEFLFQ